jgi:transcription termination/antitermination protein NusG
MDTLALRWVAVWTMSRHERLVRDHLLEKNVDVFLPLLVVPSTRKDRKKTIEIPVFPGYLFAHVQPDDGYAIKTTRGVVAIVGPSPLQHSFVSDGEIEAVRTMVESGLKVDPYPYLNVGTLIRVRNGPLLGLEGILVEKRGNFRVIVSVHLLGKSICAEVSADQLERI